MSFTAVLAGNPNSGKTTLFNSLTGSRQKIGNWPGVTIEKKEGRLKNYQDIILIDLPGIYSLSPYSMEERISRDYLVDESPDVIINIVDGTNLERNLYLTTQLIELQIPLILCVNMSDIIDKRGDKLNSRKLEKMLHIPVVEISALKETGIQTLTDTVSSMLQQKEMHPGEVPDFYSPETRKCLTQISELIGSRVPEKLKLYCTVQILEQDKRILDKLQLPEKLLAEIKAVCRQFEEIMDDDGESVITNEKYSFIAKTIPKILHTKPQTLSPSDKIDQIVTNRIFGLPVFFLVMFIVYYFSITTVGTWGTDWINETLFGEIIPQTAIEILTSINIHPVLISLIVDGAVAGVGAVLGFLPQMAALFLCLALLEDCGYIARVAFVMDRVFRKIGLSGKSFIPLLIGSGCSVPGIQASRTIESLQDRRLTIMTTSFIPCGAKLPVIALIANAIFGGAAWVAGSMYFLGVAAVIVSGLILKKTFLFAGDPLPFVMELPSYHFPEIKGVILTVYTRCLSFVRRAGTVIFVSSCFIWFFSNFDWRLQMTAQDSSMLAAAGRFISPVFSPLGFGNWQATVATLQGFIAKENVVSTIGILMGLSAEATENSTELLQAFQGVFTPLSGMSFLVFNMLCMPCFAAVGAMHTEFGNNKWTLFAVGYQMMFAYVLSFIFYQLGLVFFAGEPFNLLSISAVILLGTLIYLIARPNPYIKQKKNSVPYSVKS